MRERSYPIAVIALPPKLHPHVAAIGPTQLHKRLSEPRKASLRHGLILIKRHEHADAPHAVALLRACRERPRRRAAEERDRLATIHSTTSSARGIIDGGMARPSALAVLRFTTISNLVGNCTGSSPGFAPRRMRSLKPGFEGAMTRTEL